MVALMYYGTLCSRVVESVKSSTLTLDVEQLKEDDGKLLHIHKGWKAKMDSSKGHLQVNEWLSNGLLVSKRIYSNNKMLAFFAENPVAYVYMRYVRYKTLSFYQAIKNEIHITGRRYAGIDIFFKFFKVFQGSIPYVPRGNWCFSTSKPCNIFLGDRAGIFFPNPVGTNYANLQQFPIKWSGRRNFQTSLYVIP